MKIKRNLHQGDKSGENKQKKKRRGSRTVTGLQQAVLSEDINLE